MPPVLVRTDRAHEEDSLTPTTCGAFLVDQLKGVKECFGIPVPEAIREAWKVSLALNDHWFGATGFPHPPFCSFVSVRRLICFEFRGCVGLVGPMAGGAWGGFPTPRSSGAAVRFGACPLAANFSLQS